MYTSPWTDADAQALTAQLTDLERRIAEGGERLAGDEASVLLVQAALQFATRAYSALRQSEHDVSPFVDDDAVPATDVIIAVSNMLDAADVDVFELAMCKTMAGA